MPNIITHKIFGEEVLKKLNRKEILNMIQHHEHLFYIGTNGPDFLFFHHAAPWEAWKDKTLDHLGSAVHREGVNEFYREAIQCIKEQKDNHVKEAMTVYLCGHLCHWALDQTTHPYIFYCTGDCKGASAGLHHRFESMLDTQMLKRFHNTQIADYPYYDICNYDEEMLKAISRIYVPVASKVFHTEILVNQIRESLDSWKKLQVLLYDPTKKKYNLLKKIEKVIHKPWYISGNIVKNEIDEDYDILNESHKQWIHPCDHTLVSNASFLELFEEATDLACEVITCLISCVLKNENSDSLCAILKDRAYDTGMTPDKKMEYFNVIYDEE